MFDDGNPLDVVNQITLNCLISKSQLAKINDKKIKKHAAVVRLKQINENKNNLIELYEKLLNGIEPDDLCDDVKKSYEHFVDKCIFYFNVKSQNYDNTNDNTNRLHSNTGTVNYYTIDNSDNTQDLPKYNDIDSTFTLPPKYNSNSNSNNNTIKSNYTNEMM